jgi:hypothetical protein
MACLVDLGSLNQAFNPREAIACALSLKELTAALAFPVSLPLCKRQANIVTKVTKDI